MKQPDDNVLINVRVTRKFRTDAAIASKTLDKPISEIVVEALEKAIAQAKAKSDEVAA
jgi:hypothetical protein